MAEEDGWGVGAKGLLEAGEKVHAADADNDAGDVAKDGSQLLSPGGVSLPTTGSLSWRTPSNAGGRGGRFEVTTPASASSSASKAGKAQVFFRSDQDDASEPSETGVGSSSEPAGTPSSTRSGRALRRRMSLDPTDDATGVQGGLGTVVEEGSGEGAAHGGAASGEGGFMPPDSLQLSSVATGGPSSTRAGGSSHSVHAAAQQGHAHVPGASVRSLHSVAGEDEWEPLQSRATFSKAAASSPTGTDGAGSGGGMFATRVGSPKSRGSLRRGSSLVEDVAEADHDNELGAFLGMLDDDDVLLLGSEGEAGGEEEGGGLHDGLFDGSDSEAAGRGAKGRGGGQERGGDESADSDDSMEGMQPRRGKGKGKGRRSSSSEKDPSIVLRALTRAFDASRKQGVLKAIT